MVHRINKVLNMHEYQYENRKRGRWAGHAGVPPPPNELGGLRHGDDS